MKKDVVFAHIFCQLFGSVLAIILAVAFILPVLKKEGLSEKYPLLPYLSTLDTTREHALFLDGVQQAYEGATERQRLEGILQFTLNTQDFKVEETVGAFHLSIYSSSLTEIELWQQLHMLLTNKQGVSLLPSKEWKISYLNKKSELLAQASYNLPTLQEIDFSMETELYTKIYAYTYLFNGGHK